MHITQTTIQFPDIQLQTGRWPDWVILFLWTVSIAVMCHVGLIGGCNLLSMDGVHGCDVSGPWPE